MIALRNYFPHAFLYELDNKGKEDGFKKLLGCSEQLASIKNKMQQFIGNLTDQDIHTYVGKSQAFKAEERDFNICWKASLEEIGFLEKMMEDQEALKAALSPSLINKAIDCSVKNICQLFEDYSRQGEIISEAVNFKEKDWKKILECQMKAMKNDDAREGLALLAQARDLRIALAHPNMKKEAGANQQMREKFLANLSKIKKGLQFLWNYAHQDVKNVVFYPPNLNELSNSFHYHIFQVSFSGNINKKQKTAPHPKKEVDLQADLGGTPSLSLYSQHKASSSSLKQLATEPPKKKLKSEEPNATSNDGLSLIANYGNSDSEEEENTKGKNTPKNLSRADLDRLIACL